MFTKPSGRTELRKMRADDRGAVMVLGIFMCSCLVGALWYLAGIGEAIIYRERLQEAADAVAFSDAALHARGMNLIVLINLIMACILGVRVALRVAQIVLGVAAAVFVGLGIFCPPFLALVEPCVAGIEEIQTAIGELDPSISEALTGLSKAQVVVKEATTRVAVGAAVSSVGTKYGKTFPVDLKSLTDGLPVKEGTSDKLCQEAGGALGSLMGWLFTRAGLPGNPKQDKATQWLADKMRGLVSVSPQFFCGIGSAASAPPTVDLFNDSVDDRCDHEPESETKAFSESEKTWLAKCAELQVACTSKDESGKPLDQGKQQGTVDAKKQAQLDRLRRDRDANARSLKEYDVNHKVLSQNRAACITWAKHDMQRRQAEQPDDSNGQGSESADGKTPKQVSDFRNGNETGQLMAIALGDALKLRRPAQLVRVGALKDARALGDSFEAQIPSFAQAEYFFDCDRNWDACNENQEAMWQLRWRARLRRFNAHGGADRVLSAASMGGSAKALLASIQSLGALAGAPAGLAVQNAALREDLARALSDGNIRTHGVH